MTTLTETRPARVLVCAATCTEPAVVLADGSYETECERVFWRGDRHDEVLRLPLTAAVSVRPIHHHDASSSPLGEWALLAAVRSARRRPEPLAPPRAQGLHR